MFRPHLLAHVAFAALICGSQGGCQMIQAALIIVKGTDAPADYKGLAGKTVAVVCTTEDSFDAHAVMASKDIGRHVSRLLRQHTMNVKIVDYRKVDDWMDRNELADPTELGRDVDADMVLTINIEQFGFHSGSTLYQGRATVLLEVRETETGEIVYDKTLSDVVFPTSAVPSAGMSETQFRNKFSEVLGEKIATRFYKHDAYFDFANDSTVLN